TVCVVGKMRDLILQLSKSSIYSTKPNLVYGKNDDPSEVLPRMTGLDQLSEHVSAMLKGSQRQTHSEEKQAA
ncbi:hypothetical protein PO663_12070, partial [Enterobacter roggenkampii]